MAKKFDVAAVVKESLGDVRVSEVDTVRTIPAAEILPNPKNFYELSDLDDLAASIEQNGLIDPLIVKRMEDGRYMILSGHRRFAAMTEILGKTEISCLIRQPVSDVFEELMLIEANRTQRKMSAADLSKQAERYTELLVQLKEAGVAIPGRLRDRVAEALQVSSTKLARLHAIRENLVPELLARFDAGEINESKAYEISKTPEEFQKTIAPRPAWHLEQLNIGIAAETWENAERRKAEEPEPAPKAVTPSSTSWDAEAYLELRQQEDDAFFWGLNQIADRFLPELADLNSRQEGIERLKERFGRCYDSLWGYDNCEYDATPKGLSLSSKEHNFRDILRTWTAVYDMLCQIALDRLGSGIRRLIPEPAEGVSESDQRPAGLEWHDTQVDGPPPEGTMNVVCWSAGCTHGLYKPLPSMMAEEFRLGKNTNCRWWAIVPSPFEGQEEEA